MSMSLTTYAADISNLHQKAQQHAATAIHCAMQAGQLLIEAKAGIEHGGWLPFVESTGMSARKAQSYMQLANNADKLKCADSAYLSIDQALKYLAEPKEEKPDQDDDSATSPESTLAPGEYLYKRWDDTIEQWIWPHSKGKWHWVLLHCEGDEGFILSDDKPVELMEEGALTYPGVVRRRDDDGLERAFFARSEFMEGRPDAMPNLDAKTAWGRLTYRDKDWWPAWRLIGQGMDVGRKLHTNDKGELNRKGFSEWCDDHGLGDMSDEDKEHALYAADEWDFIFRLMERSAKKHEAAT